MLNPRISKDPQIPDSGFRTRDSNLDPVWALMN